MSRAIYAGEIGHFHEAGQPCRAAIVLRTCVDVWEIRTPVPDDAPREAVSLRDWGLRTLSSSNGMRVRVFNIEDDGPDVERLVRHNPDYHDNFYDDCEAPSWHFLDECCNG